MLKKFVFNLEKILRIRAWDEEAARLELGRAMSALSQIEQDIAQNEQKRYSASAADFSQEASTMPPASPSTNGEAGKPLSAGSLLALNNYLERLNTEKERLLAEQQTAQKTADEKMEAWREAAAQKKALENLKERRQAEHKRETLLAEEKELDEIAQTRRHPLHTYPAAETSSQS
jgi:flagellar FliJ protein